MISSAALSMAPTSWLGLPEWSLQLRSIPGLILREQVSADPRVTLFWVLMLTASTLVALYSLASPLSPRGMNRIALLAVLGCSLYAVLAWGVWQAGWNYPFFEKISTAQAAYGFFPNRNHTAGFLLTGAILSLGLIHRGLSGKKLVTAMIAAFTFTLLTSMILFFSISRGGLLFLLVGIAVWILGLGKYRSARLMIASTGVFAMILIFFLSSGSGLLDRLKGSSPEGTPSAQSAPSRNGELLGDSRLRIAKDTIPIIVDHPLTGTGLGTYGLVYPFYADKSLRELSTALHAESDWLTLCSEAGIPAVLIPFAAVLLLSIRIPKLETVSGEDWPLRWAFLSAFFAELLHGFVDVPLHKPELGWWVLLLGGVGFAIPGGQDAERSLSLGIQRVLFILGGIATLALGSLMIWAQWGGGESMPPFAVATAQKRFLTLFGDGSDPVAVKRAAEELRKTIAQYPMHHELYYQLANILLASEKDVNSAKSLFVMEQALWPRDPMLPFYQGMLLAPLEPLTTATYWNEALTRQLFVDGLPTSPLPRAASLYGSMIRLAADNPALLYRMPTLGDATPEMRMVWLTSPACDPALIAEAINDSSFMQQLNPKEQGHLFDLWWRRGDKAAVAAFLDTHPEYHRAAIQTTASLLASSGREDEACRLIIDTFVIPMPVPKKDGPLIQAAAGVVPDDPLDAAKYYMDLGNDVAARRLLLEAGKEGNAGVKGGEPLLLRAQLEYRSGKWGDALGALLGYLHVTGKL